MFYAKGTYLIDTLERLTKDQWLALPLSKRSDIRLALSSSVVYSKGTDKTRIMQLQSKLIGYSMGTI